MSDSDYTNLETDGLEIVADPFAIVRRYYQTCAAAASVAAAAVAPGSILTAPQDRSSSQDAVADNNDDHVNDYHNDVDSADANAAAIDNTIMENAHANFDSTNGLANPFATVQGYHCPHRTVFGPGATLTASPSLSLQAAAAASHDDDDTYPNADAVDASVVVNGPALQIAKDQVSLESSSPPLDEAQHSDASVADAASAGPEAEVVDNGAALHIAKDQVSLGPSLDEAQHYTYVDVADAADDYGPPALQIAQDHVSIGKGSLLDEAKRLPERAALEPLRQTTRTVPVKGSSPKQQPPARPKQAPVPTCATNGDSGSAAVQPPFSPPQKKARLYNKKEQSCLSAKFAAANEQQQQPPNDQPCHQNASVDSLAPVLVATPPLPTTAVQPMPQLRHLESQSRSVSRGAADPQPPLEQPRKLDTADVNSSVTPASGQPPTATAVVVVQPFQAPRLFNLDAYRRTPSHAELNAAQCSGILRRELLTWYQRFDELINYAEQHGNCDVPHRYFVNPLLGLWVHKQRTEKAFWEDGKPSTLTIQRIDYLDSIRFCWTNDQAHKSWMDRFAELQAYKEQHGHCNVPSTCKVHPALGRWVKTQRTRYKLFQSGMDTKTLTQSRVDMLDSLGFVWDGQLLTLSARRRAAKLAEQQQQQPPVAQENDSTPRKRRRAAAHTCCV